MRILLLASAYNGLTQRAHLELLEGGHTLSLELALSERHMREAVDLFQPDLILCPFLKARVPADIWQNHLTIVIHPGVKGDRGPSSLDWAITDELRTWGVTALEASEEMDAGDIWATRTFPVRGVSKASLYRQEVTDAALACIRDVLEKVAANTAPEPLDYAREDVTGRLRPLMKQSERTIDWEQDSAAEVIRKVRAADSFPGVKDTVTGVTCFLFGAHAESTLRGKPGEILAQRHGAICRMARDGAVWLTHLRRAKDEYGRYFKLPATKVLERALGERLSVPEIPLSPFADVAGETYRDIWYEEAGEVGTLHFDFHNGAMTTEQCERLEAAFRAAAQRPTRVIVLSSGDDFYSNGIHLNMIEAATDPALESWRNINAINDLIHAILTCDTHLTVSAVAGNAGAGGVVFALACDRVYVRGGRVFNPHYKSMGLHGSEYWTYLLPRRVGEAKARELTDACLPVSARHAAEIGLVDAVLAGEPGRFASEVAQIAEILTAPDLAQEALAQKRRTLARIDLSEYRRRELEAMKEDFDDPIYQQARRNFVYKIAPRETPARLALHRCPTDALGYAVTHIKAVERTLSVEREAGAAEPEAAEFAQ